MNMSVFFRNRLLSWSWFKHQMAIFVSLAAICTIAATVPAAAQTHSSVTASDQQAARSIIERQMEAFRRDDGETAFSYAAPAIRRQFVTAENFMRMVRIAYFPVYRPKKVIFAAFRLIGSGDMIVRTLIVGPDEKTVQAIYRLQRQNDGFWRISACVLLPFDGKGA